MAKRKVNLEGIPRIEYGQSRTVFIPFGWTKWAIVLYASVMAIVVGFNNQDRFVNGSDLLFRCGLATFLTLIIISISWLLDENP
jgi:hypothetical protein